MSDITTINTGEAATHKLSGKIKTSGVGSCLVIVFYDEITKTGGMAHSMLPMRKPGMESKNGKLSAKYVYEAMDLLLKDIETLGGSRQHLVAKLVGGAKMFKILSGDNKGIGFQNIESAKNKLQELGIMIDSEDVGGTVGRMAQLDLSNGVLEVQTRM